MAKAAATVERKILFFRANCGFNAANMPLPFDPVPALNRINALPFDNSRYEAVSDGRLNVLWIDHIAKPQRVRFGTIRRSNLPAVERAGQLKPLGIAQDSGIAEQTHAVFFPDNIVGFEFNFYGPRPSRLASYLVSKAHQHCPELVFEALIRKDVMDRLNSLQGIRLFDLRIRKSFIDTVAEANTDLGSCFRAASNAGGAEELEVILRPTRGSKEGLWNGLAKFAKRLLKAQEFHSEVSRFVVKGFDPETNRMEEIDLLSEELIARKKVVLENERFRSVDAASAYGAIHDAYKELKDELLSAAGVLP